MGSEYGDILSWLPGKASQECPEAWLPSWQHMADTAEIMSLLVRDWLPESIRLQLCQSLSEEDMLRVARFLALVHDLGKLTPLFVSKILPMLPAVREHLRAMNFFVAEAAQFMDARHSPHGLAGAIFLCQEGCPRGIASVVAAHHGKPAAGIDAAQFREDGYDYPLHYFGLHGQGSREGQRWHLVRKAWLDFALRDCGYASASDLPVLNQRTQMLLSGLLVVADWVASNPQYCPLISPDDAPCFAPSRERAVRAWEKLSLPARWEADRTAVDADAFRECFGFEPNSVQQSVLSAVNMAVEPGLFILEAQMGVGKTEAALAAAQLLAGRCGAGGLFFGLPTQATANGLFPRLVAWAQKQSEACENAIRLAHGMAAMNEDYNALFHGSAAVDNVEDPSGLIVHQWFEGRKKALLADFVVGTVDQLLMASLRQRHVMLRHLGLAGKVVVIDEVHAYDAYMNVYLENSLRWLGAYGVPVILLSATLPLFRRKALMAAYTGKKIAEAAPWATDMAYPLLTWNDGEEIRSMALPTDDGRRRRVEITPLCLEQEGEEAQLTVDFLRKKLRDGGCAAVVMNTVRRAQAMAAALRQQFPDRNVMLVHAHYLSEDRTAWEEALLRRTGKRSTLETRDGLIVVGTQVLEQSLDIDADVMVTDLCPMDLLLQRMGRLHRHDRVRPTAVASPCCGVLSSQDGFESGAELIYGQWLLMQTARHLPAFVHLPQDIPALVQSAYAAPEGLVPGTPQAQAYQLHESRIAEQREKARAFCLKPPVINPGRATRDTIDGMLDTDAPDDERLGNAAVRDGEPSVEVLVMMHHANGQIGFVPWHEQGRIVPRDSAPAPEDARAIAQQRIRLPQAVCGKNEHLLGETIALLEEISRREVAEWLLNGLLRGELFLFLDESGQTTLRGYRLMYSQSDGLSYRKEEENHG